MPRSVRKVRTPSYRSRSGYDQAIVTLTDSGTGKRRDYWLGEHGSRASRELYHRVIAAWEASDRRFPDAGAVDVRGPRGGGHARGSIRPPGGTDGAAAARGNVGQTVVSGEAEAETVAGVIQAYWRWSKRYYRPDEAATLKIALRLLRAYYGTLPATSFGPTKLRLLREEMIRGNPAADPPREPWSRNYINSQVRRIQRMFRWAASHELVPPAVHQGLATLEALKRGRSNARENEPVGPVPLDLVEGGVVLLPEHRLGQLRGQQVSDAAGEVGRGLDVPSTVEVGDRRPRGLVAEPELRDSALAQLVRLALGVLGEHQAAEEVVADGADHPSATGCGAAFNLRNLHGAESHARRDPPPEPAHRLAALTATAARVPVESPGCSTRGQELPPARWRNELSNRRPKR